MGFLHRSIITLALAVFKFALLCTIIVSSNPSAAQAQTGTLGFAVGFGFGLSGVDISDGQDRINVGALTQNLNLGLHTGPFVFLLEGSMAILPGSLPVWDSISDGGLRFKSYLSENWHFSLQGGVASLKRSRADDYIMSLYDRGGWYAGGQVGWDLLGGGAQGGYRFSLNAGAKRYDFATQELRQGIVTTRSELANRYLGITYFAYFGLDWYL